MRIFVIFLFFSVTFLSCETKNDSTQKGQSIEHFKNEIKSNANWYNSISKKAKERNISIEEMLALDAQFMYENQVFVTEKTTEEASPFKREYTLFSFNQLIPLILGLISIIISLSLFFNNKNYTWSLIYLTIGGVFLRVFVLLLNNYINGWDEIFHALVAKNMSSNPFHPMLYKNPILNFDEFSWVSGQTWLHKQPLFLWQIALSIKLFGANVIALRIPSIIMSGLLVLIIYDIGKTTINYKVGYYAALLFVFSSYSIDLANGAVHTDHNDMAFLFYVSASIWAWTRYENTNSKHKQLFLILVGVFSGCAVLNKWLVGLLVYFGWGLSILLIKERRVEFINYKNMIISFAISLIIFIPWQIYIFFTFKELALHEYKLNTRHLFEVIEDHGGDFWYHFFETTNLYGINKFYVLLSLIFYIFYIRKSTYKVAFLSFITCIFLFYTIASTKMPTFTFVLLSIGYVVLGLVFERLMSFFIENVKVKYKGVKTFITITFIALIMIPIFNLNKIEEQHVKWYYKKEKTHPLYINKNNTKIINSLNNEFDNLKGYVVFNCWGLDNISVMFFTDAVSAYSFIPNEQDCKIIKAQNHKIFVFDNGKLPEYLMKDTTVIKYKGKYMW